MSTRWTGRTLGSSEARIASPAFLVSRACRAAHTAASVARVSSHTNLASVFNQCVGTRRARTANIRNLVLLCQHQLSQAVFPLAAMLRPDALALGNEPLELQAHVPPVYLKLSPELLLRLLTRGLNGRAYLSVDVLCIACECGVLARLRQAMQHTL